MSVGRWVGGSVRKWSVVSWSVVGRSVVGGFNKTLCVAINLLAKQSCYICRISVGKKISLKLFWNMPGITHRLYKVGKYLYDNPTQF